MDPLEALSSALDRGPVLVRVRTGKRTTRIASSEPFAIDVAAKPIEGAANEALLGFLKKTVGACRIRSGAASKTKLIERI